MYHGILASFYYLSSMKIDSVKVGELLESIGRSNESNNRAAGKHMGAVQSCRKAVGKYMEVVQNSRKAIGTIKIIRKVFLYPST